MEAHMSSKILVGRMYLECPCCGGVGAEADERGLFHDGQELICGCVGSVSFDSETEPGISIHDCECEDS